MGFWDEVTRVILDLVPNGVAFVGVLTFMCFVPRLRHDSTRLVLSEDRIASVPCSGASVSCFL